MINVISSNIKAIGYDNNDLFVEFKNNTLYKYSNVPQKIFENFRSAESKGKFLNKEIKGKYSYHKERWSNDGIFGIQYWY